MPEPDAATPRRLAAYRRGVRAEYLAAGWLLLQGYRLLALRYRAPGGEVDLVVARRGCIIFVEVKARPSHQEGLEAITATKLKRISAAARHFLARQKGADRASIRLDAVVLAPWRWPRHVPMMAELAL
jgi:putative endonuclease